MQVKKINTYVVGMVMLMSLGYVEEIDITTETFESALIIEGSITTQETQKILLSRTFRLEEEEPSPGTDATVRVTDSQGTQYSFQETIPFYCSF